MIFTAKKHDYKRVDGYRVAIGTCACGWHGLKRESSAEAHKDWIAHAIGARFQ